MRISGAHTMAVSPERAFALLQNPEVLARAMSGCESLERVGDNEYAMRMKVALAGMSELFEGRVRILDSKPPSGFRLMVEGKGKLGSMKAEGLLTLTPARSGSGTGCHVQYEGNVQVGGTIAAIGQHLLGTTSRLLLKRFFERVDGEASAWSHFVA
jgi:carbon monoxide dehydrogenase subunit G